MKKFITNIPLQKPGKLYSLRYQAVGCPRLQMDGPTRFPILAAVSGYVQPGETFRLLAVTPDSEDARQNSALLSQELEALCGRRGILCPGGVETVSGAENERVTSHTGTLQKLINLVEDDDELFACITFGTKPASLTVLTAVQYAYRLKRNASISCIVYGEVDRRAGNDPAQWKAYLYDETALIQLGEMVRVLADRGVKNPKGVLDGILGG